MTVCRRTKGAKTSQPRASEVQRAPPWVPGKKDAKALSRSGIPGRRPREARPCPGLACFWAFGPPRHGQRRTVAGLPEALFGKQPDRQGFIHPPKIGGTKARLSRVSAKPAANLRGLQPPGGGKWRASIASIESTQSIGTSQRQMDSMDTMDRETPHQTVGARAVPDPAHGWSEKWNAESVKDCGLRVKIRELGCSACSKFEEFCRKMVKYR